MILVTGGTGLLGRHVTQELVARGQEVRVLSRRPHADLPEHAELVQGDLATGEGVDAALAGVDAIVHCAKSARSADVDVAGTDRLLEAARAGNPAQRPHFVYISIVGIDLVPVSYYRSKLLAERLVAGSRLPWSTLRATQFHEFAVRLLQGIARPPVAVVPRGWLAQPVAVERVAERLVELACGQPQGRVTDLGGPQVRTLADFLRSYLAATGQHRRVVEVPVPGAASRAVREGGLLTPEHPGPGPTFEAYLRASR